MQLQNQLSGLSAYNTSQSLSFSGSSVNFTPLVVYATPNKIELRFGFPGTNHQGSTAPTAGWISSISASCELLGSIPNGTQLYTSPTALTDLSTTYYTNNSFIGGCYLSST